MKWDVSLFQWANQKNGQNRVRDRFVLLLAHYLIYVLVFLSLTWAITALYTEDANLMIRFMKEVMTASTIGLLVSYVGALVIRRPRPVATLPNIHQLFQPYETWKSFPSDHTLVSFVFVGLVAMFGAPLWFVMVLIGIGMIIGTSRVCAGVHYPVDILGGIFYGLCFAILAPLLLVSITQPMYTFFLSLFI